MAVQTQDHRAQICYRDTEVQIGSTGASTTVSAAGGIRYSGSIFQLLDAQGQYDPRLVYQLTHAQLNDLVHVMSGGGPVLNGAYLVTTYVGGAFLSTETWYTTSAKTLPVSQHKLVYPQGNYTNPTTETWTVYDASGNVAHVVSDALTFTGVTEVARSRSYS